MIKNRNGTVLGSIKVGFVTKRIIQFYSFKEIFKTEINHLQGNKDKHIEYREMTKQFDKFIYNGIYKVT